MAIYSFWIFDRHCNCIFDREWTIPADSSSGITNSKQNEDTAKLIYGMIFSLQSMSRRMSSKSNTVRTIATGKYRIHLLSTITGLSFVLFSDLKQQDLSQLLQYIYSEIYVKYVARNMLSPIDYAENDSEKRGQGFRKINNRNFIKAVQDVLGPMVNQ
ncbi:HGL248Cp [Eremothecium sinecaudum]|uniref:Trafficking protein particle complex subunit n=1 Tax=Eremothecium sinecaudum TaxID=45286 RepID=A0A0X8HV87_9SACH|nr:HGL248Cp [Eremothecium sinecaudum]AMD22092.1 HGL248Cp [Eremothecium sinecaudum]